MISDYRHDGRSNMEDALLEIIRRLGIKQEAATGINPDAAFASFTAGNYNHGNANSIEDLLEEIILRLVWLNGNGGGGTTSVNIVNTLADLLGVSTGGTFEVQDVELVDSTGSSVMSIPVLPPNNFVTIPDSTITQVNGSSTDVPFGTNPVCSFPRIEIVDQDNNLIQNVDSWVPQVQVQTSSSGIVYLRPIATATQSVTPGDTFSALQRGYFQYSPPAGVLATLNGQDQNGWYRLKFNNAFGNDYRFTTSTGRWATDGKLGFVLNDFQADGAFDYYIIDHLTGIGIYQPNINTSPTTGMDWYESCAAVEARNASSFFGWNNWMLFHSALHHLVVRKESQYFQISNPFRRGIISGFNENSYWLGEYDETTATDRARLIGSQHDGTRVSAPDGFVGISTYMCRNHYL
jgi:hypothetical protein